MDQFVKDLMALCSKNGYLLEYDDFIGNGIVIVDSNTNEYRGYFEIVEVNEENATCTIKIHDLSKAKGLTNKRILKLDNEQ